MTQSHLTKLRDLELLQGMCNCYSVCGADFEDTVRMVSRARGLEPGEVKQTLRRIRAEHGHEEEYKELRARLPETFPL